MGAPRIIAAMLTSEDLIAYIDRHNIAAKLVCPPFPTPTVVAAAKAMNVPADAIIKSVLFIIRRIDPLLIIASGERRISQRLVADHLSVGKKQVKVARPAEVLAVTGYPVGGVPPFGHQKPLTTWLDPAVLEQERVYGGGGQEAALLELSTSELVRVTSAKVVPVCS